MLKSWKFWLVIGSIAGLTVLFIVGFGFDPKYVPSPLVGRKAPPFEVASMVTGEKVSLESLRGTPVLLNFWASWCVACRDEAKVLEAAHRKYGGDPSKFRVIGIAIQDTPEAAMGFARRFGKTYYLALDTPEGEHALNYGLYGVPESFLIGADGTILHKVIGPVTESMVQEKIPALIAGTLEAE